MDEVRLPGGNAGGAVLVDGNVRRSAGPWTPAVHSLLRFLEVSGFDGAPRALGIDAEGREVLSYLPGDTVGDSRPWPPWVHSEEALVDVGRWLRRYHDVVVDFDPPVGQQWRMVRSAPGPGDIIGHNDAAPYNAVWRSDSKGAWRLGEDSPPRLVGFIDWDFAAPCPPVLDFAFLAFSWVPLHARAIVMSEGFIEFDDRPRRLRTLLDAYRYEGTVADLLEAVQVRISDHICGIRELADGGDALFQRLIDDGVVSSLERALAELNHDVRAYVQ
jgi:hypothetical protein